MAKTDTKQNIAEKGVKKVSAGTVLFREEDTGRRMYVIKAGRVRLTKRIQDTEVVVEELGAGEFCGELAMVNEQPRPVTATVVKEAKVIQIEASQFENMLRSNSDIALRMMKKMSQRLTEAQFRLSNFALRTTRARLMHQLRHEALRKSDDGAVTEPTPLPDNLADVLGLEVGEVKKLLTGLVKDDLLGIDNRGQFQITDPDGFERYLRYLELNDRFEYNEA